MTAFTNNNILKNKVNAFRWKLFYCLDNVFMVS